MNNADWLVPLNYLEFLRDVGRQFSVNRMLAADAYRTRYESPEGLNFLEFNYMLLQAYDFLHLCAHHGCRLQMGGSDQWGNIVAGIDLIRRLGGPQAFGVTFPLITTASGAKMGKTAAGRRVARRRAHEPLRLLPVLGQHRRPRPRALPRALHPAADGGGARARRRRPPPTRAPRSGASPSRRRGSRTARRRRAAPRRAAAALFGGGAPPDEALRDAPTAEIPAAELAAGVEAFELFHRVGLAKSRGEARRLIEGGGAYVGGRQVAAFNERIGAADAQDGRILLRAGKKKYLLLRLT